MHSETAARDSLKHYSTLSLTDSKSLILPSSATSYLANPSLELEPAAPGCKIICHQWTVHVIDEAKNDECRSHSDGDSIEHHPVM
jgi:hypothetical protein